MSKSVAILGECMLELSHENSLSNKNDLKSVFYGGDTLNTSVYLARNDINVSYITGLGDDKYSDWLIDSWTSENIDCSLVTRISNRMPGLYMINVDNKGERSFMYWRDTSAAKIFFADTKEFSNTLSLLRSFTHIYLSGITLALMSDDTLNELFLFLSSYKKEGGVVIFDSNYRPNLWSNPDTTKAVYKNMYKLTDIALPTFEDEASLFNYQTEKEVIDSIRSYNVNEVVLKMGVNGCTYFENEDYVNVSANIVELKDSTAAGDSFNAGYLSSRLQGKTIRESCVDGHFLASQVVQFKGAIIPKEKLI